MRWSAGKRSASPAAAGGCAPGPVNPPSNRAEACRQHVRARGVSRKLGHLDWAEIKSWRLAAANAETFGCTRADKTTAGIDPVFRSASEFCIRKAQSYQKCRFDADVLTYASELKPRPVSVSTLLRDCATSLPTVTLGGYR